ncbi:MAG TPA: ATP-binding protein [Actinomycetota bacterium]|nr:ATP-binding protein [Actinomycetota bacterium]
MNITFSLQLPRDAVSVPAVRRVCRCALEDLGVAAECVHDVELALTEACTNVLKHADGTGDDYEVAIELNDRECVIRVVDSGGGFTHEEFGREIAHSSAEGGRGIHLMRTLVDSMTFESRPSRGTIVRLHKTLDFANGSILQRLSEASSPN